MSRERWGTFSVADHLRPRAFVAEVLLYDRLIIPVPPNAEERKRWSEPPNNWDPDRQERFLDLLGDLAVRVPWDLPKQMTFNTRYKLAQQAGRDTNAILDCQSSGWIDPYAITRGLLGQEFRPPLPYGVAKVWTLSAYPSYSVYQEDTVLGGMQEKREVLAMVLTHRFLVPEDVCESDEELLKQVVDLARHHDFKENRVKFHRWQEDIIEQEIPPNKAVEEMEVYLQQYNEVVKRATKEVYWKFGSLVLKTGLDLVGAGMGEPTSVAGALVDVLSFGKFEHKPKIDAGDYERAAMIHDVQKNLPQMGVGPQFN